MLYLLAGLCCIRHEENMHRVDIFHLYSKNTVDSGEQAIPILVKVVKVLGQCFNKNFHFGVVHRFQQEFFIIGKEEE